MLTEQQLRLYARQVILRELGPAGQAQLCAAEVALSPADAAAGAARVAADYLRRAGIQVSDSASLPVHVASQAEVEATAGHPGLQACAEWLLGAWAAVEAVKRCVGVGSPARTPPAPLTAEVD